MMTSKDARAKTSLNGLSNGKIISQMRLIWVAFGNIDDEIKDHDAAPEHLPEGHCLSLSNSE